MQWAGTVSLRPIAALTITALAVASLSSSASADTLDWALVQAYQNNPTLNAQRASLRAQDEAVPQAPSGYRPRGAGTPAIANQYQHTFSKAVTPIGPVYDSNHSDFTPRSVGITATQTLFNGFQTANRTRQAEAQVSAGRATLAFTESTVLLNAATAYMNLI